MYTELISMLRALCVTMDKMLAKTTLLPGRTRYRTIRNLAEDLADKLEVL